MRKIDISTNAIPLKKVPGPPPQPIKDKLMNPKKVEKLQITKATKQLVTKEIRLNK